MKRIAVITGASSGLGKEYANTAAEHLALDEIWLIARRKDKLKETAFGLKTPAQIIPMDITSDDEMKKLEERLDREQPQIVCLINAAGMGKTGKIESLSSKDTAGMIDLNCRALAEMTRMCIPYLTKGAWVLQIASIAGFQPMPQFAIYAASKAFVQRYSEALHYELKEKGIHVTCVCPYWIKDTEFIGIAEKESKAYSWMPLSLKKADVVKKSWNDVRLNRLFSTPGILSSTERYLSRIMPDQVTMFILDRFSRH